MSKVRLWATVVLVGAVLWWLHPKPGAEYGRDVTEITIWFNDLIVGRHLDVVDAFERRFDEKFGFRAQLGSSAVRSGQENEGNPQRLMCGIAGGVPPEVVEYDRFAICQWAARGAFLDLTPLIEKDRREIAAERQKLAELRDRGAPAAEIKAQQAHLAFLERYQVQPEDYYGVTWDECQYQGGLYGIPTYMDNRVMYCNTDLLVQAGLVDEQGQAKPPDTWEQILTKRVDVTDAQLTEFDFAEANESQRRYAVESASADFVAAGVQPGDTLSHLSTRGQVTRSLVATVDGPHRLTVRSPYRRKELSLPAAADQHVKVFDQAGYALRLSRWDDDGKMRRVGFEPQHGNAWLYLYAWANGGSLLSKDGRTCTLDDPRVVEALQWTTDVYDAYGGAYDVVAFRKSFQAYAQDPFFVNQIGLLIHGDWFLRDLARYKRDMHFQTYPPPVPAKRADDHRLISWVAGFAYCIPATCSEDKLPAAWWLVKFLASVEGGMVMNEHDAQRERAQGRLYMPRLMASKPLSAAQFEHYIDDPNVPDTVRQAVQTHLDMLAHCEHRPVSPKGQELWNAQALAQDEAWNHLLSPREALQHEQARVQRSLDEFFAPKDQPVVHWAHWLWVYFALLLVVSVTAYRVHVARHPARGFHRQEWWAGLLFASPWLIGFIVLSGGPMLFSAAMSLTDYDVINPARFVGLEHYRELFGVDWGGLDGTARVLGNTLFMALSLPVSMAVGLALAMLLNTRVRGLAWYRTMFFLPAIMPMVAASVLWMWVFNAQNGLMNAGLDATGVGWLIDWAHVQLGTPLRTPISWLSDPLTAKPALIIMILWTSGASMIIWLAGLKEIPQHLYEAASLDGAGRVRQFFVVTLPMLSPYILFNLIIGLIQTFQIFTQAYIMTPTGSPSRSTYFYVYKLFDQCFTFFNLGYGAAMAWVLFVIVIVLTLINMALSRRWVHYAGE